MAAPGGPPPPPQGQNGEPRRATDEEKDIYRHLLANAINVAYEPETADLIAQQIAGPNPVEALADTIAAVVERVGQAFIAEGVPVNGAMAIAVATSLAGDIGVNMAQEMGRPPLNADQMQAVVLRSMEILRDMQDGDGQNAAGPGAEAPMPGPGGPPPSPGPGSPPPAAPSGNGLMPGRR